MRRKRRGREEKRKKEGEDEEKRRMEKWREEGMKGGRNGTLVGFRLAKSAAAWKCYYGYRRMKEGKRGEKGRKEEKM